MNKYIFSIGIILIVVGFLFSPYVDTLEVVPGSEMYIINTGYNNGHRILDDSTLYGIKFTIPDVEQNVIKDVYIHFNSGGEGIIHTTGLSRTLTENTNEWETLSTFPALAGTWCKVINNAALQDTGSIVRCNPGEIWYLMIEMGSFWLDSSGHTSFDEGTRLYEYIDGSFVDQSYDCCFRLSAYTDELFFVDFDYEPKNPMVGQEVTFTDDSNQNLIETREWLINNIHYSNEEEITYTFDEEGDETVTLIGTSYEGTTLQQSKVISVGDEPTPPDPEPGQTGFMWIVLVISGIVVSLISLKK